MTEHPSHAKKSNGLTIIVFLLLIVGGAAFYWYAANSKAVSASPAPAARPAPTVDVAVTKIESIRVWTSFPGRLVAVNQAEIKPQVSGEIQKVLFEGGQQVNKGDLLVVIDPRPYQAAVKRAEAQLASAESRAKLAKDELERAASLVKKKLVSESVYDSAKSEHQVANAAISEIRSALAQARLDLDYCSVRAPFDGRLGRVELTVGNIVETTPNAPVLTTIVAADPIYADFNVDEQTYLRYVHGEQGKGMPVEMSLASENSVRYKGKIHAFDNQLDVSSGTIRARAIFANPNASLIPGMYANVSVGSYQPQNVLLLPSRAIATNQNKKFVYVINDDNQVTYREVQLGGQYQDQRIITHGLNEGEKVVINGLSHIRPNMVVVPQRVDALTEAQPAS